MGCDDGQGTMEERRLVSHPLRLRLLAQLRRNDAKTVSIVALATFHPNTRVQSAALHFFLGSETDADKADDSSDDDGGIRDARRDVKKLEHSMHVGTGGKKKDRLLRTVKREATKVSEAILAGRIMLTET